MLVSLEGTDNGRQKTKSWLWRHCRRAIYWLLRSPSQTCHAKPKTQINRRRTLPASFPLVGCLPATAEDFSPKSQDAVAMQQIKERGALPAYDWSWWYPSGRWPLQQYLGFTAGGAGYGQFEHKADSLIMKIQRSGRNGQRDWCMSKSTWLSPLWLSASSSVSPGC